MNQHLIALDKAENHFHAGRLREGAGLVWQTAYAAVKDAARRHGLLCSDEVVRPSTASGRTNRQAYKSIPHRTELIPRIQPDGITALINYITHPPTTAGHSRRHTQYTWQCEPFG